MMPKKTTLSLVALLQLGLYASADAQMTDRTIIDNIRGGIYIKAHNGELDGLGFWLGTLSQFQSRLKSNQFTSPQQIRGLHSLFQHLDLEDTHAAGWRVVLPDLRAFEADEVRQGKDPIFVTATVNGKKLPVAYFKFQEKGVRWAPNIRDDRYIRWYIQQYARGFANRPETYMNNWWFGLDNANFNFGKYGAMDGNKYISNVKFDPLFPQNQVEYEAAVHYFFKRAKELAPDVNFFANGGMDDNGIGAPKGPLVPFQHASGMRMENWLGGVDDGQGGSYDDRRNSGSLRTLTTAFSNHAQSFDMRHVNPADATELRLRYVGSLVAAGPNYIIGMRDSDANEVDPLLYADMRNALGDPLGKPTFTDEARASLAVRETEGGIAALNLTPSNKTVALPAGKTWHDHTGNAVTQLAVRSGAASWAVTEQGKRTAKPTINPRFAGKVTAPLAVTLSCDPWTQGASIRYTLDGSDPTESSTLYSGPFTLTSSAKVRAKGFKAGQLPSFTTEMNYDITTENPVVRFHLRADTGSEFLTSYYPLVSLSHHSGKPVTVRYKVGGGTAKPGTHFSLTEGTLTFQPGELYKTFELKVVNEDKNEPWRSIQLSLHGQTNANLDAGKDMVYIVQDNDGGKPDPATTALHQGMTGPALSRTLGLDFRADGLHARVLGVTEGAVSLSLFDTQGRRLGGSSAMAADGSWYRVGGESASRASLEHSGIVVVKVSAGGMEQSFRVTPRGVQARQW